MPDLPNEMGPEIESAIFETAIEIRNAETRKAYLARSFQNDPEGLERMRELLSIAGESTAFFLEGRRQRAELADEVIREIPVEDSPAPQDLAPPIPADPQNPRVDGYQIIGRIGEGGCGVVYEAEPERVKRRVALKVIRLGRDTETVVARFEAERQALERMDHPNIAKVLDAGRTACGRPFFVMELVRGQRITTYCDAEKLDVPARLEIFIHVCQAIQHAHQKGIIHRDIKPSNVLVAIHDGEPMPKVIDFGIAKATDDSLEGGGVLTSLDQMIGTPVYMSPEQVDLAGIDVDTRSDIYSLGALLYELLSGKPPFDSDSLTASGVSAMRRTLLEDEPPLPSTVVAGSVDADGLRVANRESERAANILRGDLDWIVTRAMEKDRSRRYQTVNNLAMDVRRYLANEPVSARRPGRVYLLGKFFRRNRVACLSGMAVALSLVAGLGAATILYVRERFALLEQERLKQEAEIARTQESLLRGQAQARANVSYVAILLSEGKVEEADDLLRLNPLDTIEPSKEAADVFRFLGNWNGVYQRWNQALACFSLMAQANRLDPPPVTLESFDLLMHAPVYLEAGDLRGYEQFRQDAIRTHTIVENSLQAEHLLKICLLKPATEDMLRQLQPVAKLCEASVVSRTKKVALPEWDALSASIYRYRSRDYQGAAEWSKKCLSYKDLSGTRSATARCISAMAHFQLGEISIAREELRGARTVIEEASRLPGESQGGAPGYWFAWSVARIFLAEARELIEK